MLRGILIVLVIVVLVFCGWALYNRGTATTFGNGDVVSHDSASNERMNTGATDIDGQPVEPTTSRSDEPGTINTVPAAEYQQNGQQNGTNQQPGYYPQTAPAPQPGQYAQIPSSNPSFQQPAAPLPVSDSIAPNPPNGLAFGGTGKYQWYREGDLTWRVDTANGSTCIAFATLEQWRLPLVASHGCGNS